MNPRLLPLLGFALIALSVPQAKANVSSCDSVAGNLVQNCGFELGVYSSTIGGNTNTSVPLDWTPNAGYDLNQGFNHVVIGPSSDVNSGNQSLSISNYDYQPDATLSQTISDVVGATYSGSIYVFSGGAGDASAFFQLQVNGVPLVNLADTVNTYTQFTFAFTGTGSDILTIDAQTDPSEWYADDVVVTGATAVTPDPSEVAPLTLGMAVLIGAVRRKTRRARS